MRVKSLKSQIWKIIFVFTQFLWFWFFLIPLAFKSERILLSEKRRNFEMFVDLVYLANVFITPFLAVNRKEIEKKLQKKAYPKIEMRQVIGTETRVRILLLNYLSYYFLIDFLSSITGILTYQKVIQYYRW